MMQPLEIRWPERYHPRNCPVHIRNELASSAAPENVWAWLIRATLWPDWYVNSAHVRILEGPGPDLAQGVKFRWKTFGVNITSTVLEYEPPERIAWDAHGLGVDAYHAWLFQPTPTGCHLLTEETQHGVLARLSSLLMPNRMHKYHQIWLEGLDRQACNGLPPVLP